jgi:hypothetical protein
VERESSLEQRERKDQEKADYVRARQERLGHELVDDGQVVVEEAPKPKAKPKAKSTAKKS